MTVTVDGLTELQAVFRAAPQKLKTAAKRNVSKTALEVKKGAQTRVKAGLSATKSHLPHYARAIDYDLAAGGLSAVVGPNPNKIQGAFGRGVEFGSARTGPIPHMLPAADDQWPLFQAGMKTAVEQAL